MTFPALLDACALVPISLTDLLLRLADAATFRPLWSADILTEVERTLSGPIGPEEAKAQRRVEVMRSHFPDAEVMGYGSLIPAMTNDPKDRHVLAAAVKADAAVIVTFNLDDFPQEALAPYDINAVHLDAFLLDQLDLHPVQTVQCLHELIDSLRNPPITVAEFLDHFRLSVPDFVDTVRPLLQATLHLRRRRPL